MEVPFVVDHQAEPGTCAGYRLTVTVLVSGYRLTVTVLASGYRLTVVVPFVVDQSPGRAREQGWIVAGVVEETRTLTSKFVLDVYTLTHYIICRVTTQYWTESLTVGGSK